MNMVVTERDKKMLGFLVAFVIALFFILMVFKPLAEQTRKLDQEIKQAEAQAAEYGSQASGAQDMVLKEEQLKEQVEKVLSRFYPMQQSQMAEQMLTILMLNQGLSIQSVNVVMPETENNLKWYQYSPDGREQLTMGQQDEEEVDAFSLYAARVTCVAEGNKEQLWALVDDISANYPAISIVSTEWSISEKTTEAPIAQLPANDNADEGGEEAVQEIQSYTAVQTDRLTISVEIFMCNQ